MDPAFFIAGIALLLGFLSGESYEENLVGVRGFEPPASTSRT
jgi:hypothetical protein